MKTHPREPAYPSLKNTGESYAGLSKREHIAALLLAGLLSNPNVVKGPTLADRHYYAEADKVAVRMANALIIELSREVR